MRILLVEDDALTIRSLRFLLEHEGFEVEVAENAASILDRFSKHLYDLVLLDIGLPFQSGFEIARTIKDVPLIFLTARDDEDSLVHAFNLGAEDYITKPFRSRELITRIQAVLRREQKQTGIIKNGDLSLDTNDHTLSVKENPVALSALEYKILYSLMTNAGQIVPRERLLDEIWDLSGHIVSDNTLTVYIKRLRQKLGDENLIQTVKGIGYKMERL